MSIRISTLEVSNFKCIDKVSISPGDARIVTAQAVNGGGKTSLLQAIRYAFDGRSGRRENPVRTGFASAEIKVGLTLQGTPPVIVSKTLSYDGKTKTAQSIGGEKATKNDLPSEVSAPITPLAYNPTDFYSMTEDGKIDFLTEVAGISLTDYNKNLSDLKKKLADAEFLKKTYNIAHTDNPVPDTIGTLIISAEDKTLVELLDAVESRQDTVKELGIPLITRTYNDLIDAVLENLPGEATIVRIRQAVEWDKKETHEKETLIKIIEVTQEINDIKDDIEALKKNRNESINKAFVKKGIALSLSDTGKILYNNVPLRERSSGELILLAAKIIAVSAQNNGIIFIHDGSLLDEAHMAELHTIAESTNTQFWIEKTTDDERLKIEWT